MGKFLWGVTRTNWLPACRDVGLVVFMWVVVFALPTLGQHWPSSFPLTEKWSDAVAWTEGAHPPKTITESQEVESILSAGKDAGVVEFASFNSFEPAANALDTEHWTLQLLPDGLIYPSYLAGMKESRFACVWVHDQDLGWIWDITLGGRVGIIRYGAWDKDRPVGVQVDIEGACFPRLDLEEGRELVSSDFRFGIPVTFGTRRWQTKLAYYHLSSHLGDEYMVRYPNVSRINYSRDVFVLGQSFYWTDDVRLYAEAAWAFFSDGGSKPWEFQFGCDYCPKIGQRRSSPFVAVNVHLREDVAFSGDLSFQTGWQWWGVSGHLLRMGIQYFTGMSEQFEFFEQYEEKLGFGVWYDY